MVQPTFPILHRRPPPTAALDRPPGSFDRPAPVRPERLGGAGVDSGEGWKELGVQGEGGRETRAGRGLGRGVCERVLERVEEVRVGE